MTTYLGIALITILVTMLSIGIRRAYTHVQVKRLNTRMRLEAIRQPYKTERVVYTQSGKWISKQ